MLQFYSYWRSSAAYRVRIALALKGLPVATHAVHLINQGGEQHLAAYKAINPAELVPSLTDGELQLNQSLAIIDYIEQLQATPALLPSEAAQAAQCKALALDIACDIHPLCNLRVLQYLTQQLQVTETQKTDWIKHWIIQGFNAIEQRLQHSAGSCCFGDNVTLADICLIPQVYNALRFQVDLTPYPLIQRIYQHCSALPAFIAAAPEQQADAR